MSNYIIRSATLNDLPAICAALAWAIDWRAPQPTPPEERIAQTGHAYLLAEWGRSGDMAVVAEVEGHPVGAVWYRLWTDAMHSYGYIDATVPELGIGVDPQWRGRGIGEALLRALLAHAQQQGVATISLSVECDNPAMQLYEKLGFERYEQVDNAWTMLWQFAS